MACDYDINGCSEPDLSQCLASPDEEIFNALSTLNIEDNSFAFYNLGLSDEDALFMSTVEVTKKDHELIGEFDQEYTSFLLQDLQKETKASLSTTLKKVVRCIDNDIEDCSKQLSKLIYKISHKLTQALGFNDADILVRVGNTIQSGWHIDGALSEINYDKDVNEAFSFISDNISTSFFLENNYKTTKISKRNCLIEDVAFVFNLIGDSTLFFNATLPERESFDRTKHNTNDDLDSSKIHSAPDGYGSVFYTGKKFGAIHSAPKSDKDRLFISVRPGPKELIQETHNLDRIEKAQEDYYSQMRRVNIV